MRILKSLALIAPLLAVGCVSATTHFGSRLERLEKTAGIYIQKDARYAVRFTTEYTRFLAQLPAHPSLDGIRVHAYLKRAQTYRMIKRDDLAAADEAAAANLQSRSPFFLQGGAPVAPIAPHDPRAAVQPPAGRSELEGPLDGPPAADPRYGRFGAPAPAAKREPRIRIDLSAGVALLTRKHLRSDEYGLPPGIVDLDNDLGMGIASGFPEVSFTATGRGMKISFGADLRWIQFNGERILDSDFNYDGVSYFAGQMLRSSLKLGCMSAFVRMVPMKSLEGKIDLDLGFRHYYIETEIERLGADHVDVLNVPMIFLGLNATQKVGRHISLGGRMKTGGSFWASASTTMLALSFEFEAHAAFILSDGLDLRLGMIYAQMEFQENKSRGRRKEAALGEIGAFAEAGLKF